MSTGKKTASHRKGAGRRAFLKTSLSAGIAAAVFPDFINMEQTAEAFEQVSQVKPFELDEITIAQLSAGMKSGQFTAHSITEKYLARIEEIDRNGITLNSIIELNPDALQIADALDKELKEKGARGPLHGIPVLIKDNIDTADRMATTAGSLALIGSKPPKNAFLVEQLIQAGAVILGKTNLSEWANIRSTHSTSGWSGRGGLTRNPYALDRNTSGSSSGSAVAVSGNLCAAAIGTETDGSIVSPSSVNGIVGIKPTLGLVSRAGIIPIAHSQDTAGPMTRTVSDAVILLGALTRIDEDDKATLNSKGKTLTDYIQYLDANGLREARIGVVRNYFGFLPQVDMVINEALEVLKKQGAVLIDPANIETIGKFNDSEFTVLLYELKADMNAYLTRPGFSPPVHSLKEIIEFNEKNAEREMPYFQQEIFLQAEAKGSLRSKEYLDALKLNHKLSRKEGIDAVMNKYKLDALVAPTESPAWVTDLINGDHFIGGSSTAAAVAGYPSITVPAGFIFGLPVGISFFGRAWSEPTLIRFAYAFEQASQHRKPPRFLSTCL
ncbi:MAG: amidase [Candidatus Fischerbacteria bacterium RBG_13_37_8]|uniref:Amidase n=1 Tax=Candidatus Fischerbacteria bacterium RBG_13_37_8 TaxID=1817863 RepID=A0A1F5V7Z6_9BACT|nr:MAG: amidase [Candidatus Fischerbacteria bacterium RBG_13_37_8]